MVRRCLFICIRDSTPPFGLADLAKLPAATRQIAKLSLGLGGKAPASRARLRKRPAAKSKEKGNAPSVSPSCKESPVGARLIVSLGQFRPVGHGRRNLSRFAWQSEVRLWVFSANRFWSSSVSLVTHFEIYASESGRLADFYRVLFGWQFGKDARSRALADSTEYVRG